MTNTTLTPQVDVRRAEERFTATGGQQVTAAEPAEILVWEMHATVG